MSKKDRIDVNTPGPTSVRRELREVTSKPVRIRPTTSTPKKIFVKGKVVRVINKKGRK